MDVVYLRGTRRCLPVARAESGGHQPHLNITSNERISNQSWIRLSSRQVQGAQQCLMHAHTMCGVRSNVAWAPENIYVNYEGHGMLQKTEHAKAGSSETRLHGCRLRKLPDT